MKKFILFAILGTLINVAISIYIAHNTNTDPLTAYSSKYVVDLPEQLNGADSLTSTYMVARLVNDTVYVYFAPYNGYQLRVNATPDKTNIESYTLFDNDRIVSTFKNISLDSIVINDNQ